MNFFWGGDIFWWCIRSQIENQLATSSYSSLYLIRYVNSILSFSYWTNSKNNKSLNVSFSLPCCYKYPLWRALRSQLILFLFIVSLSFLYYCEVWLTNIIIFGRVCHPYILMSYGDKCEAKIMKIYVVSKGFLNHSFSPEVLTKMLFKNYTHT